MSRPPEAQWTSRALLAGISVYQATLSPVYTRLGTRCRFTLSCSRYGHAVVSEYGALRGSWLAATRLLRCGPWTPADTDDPPPTR